MGIRLAAVALASVAVVATGCVNHDGGSSAASPRPSGRPSPAPTCGGERPARATGGTYSCTFTDDFNGSAIDSSKWMAQETWFSGMTSGNHDCYVNGPGNLSVSGGAAHITARHTDQPFVCHSPLGDFTSQSTVGTIATRGRFAQAYGRFEFRARFPNATTSGVHSALWLYPANDLYGAWPSSGEIDVAEWFSASGGNVYPSVHYQGETAFTSTGWSCTISDPWNYHQYAVEWTRDYMRFLYDGQECFRHTWTPAAPLVAPQPFDQPFYLVLTQVFGAETNAVTAATPTVATMDVDWVRAWK